MRKIFCIIIGIFIISSVTAGFCAQAKKASSWCTPPISLGTSKETVFSTWGEPDVKKDAGVNEAGISKEMWVYYSYPPTNILTQHSYVCNAFYLTFTGDKLTDYKAASEDKPE
jgi:hypothetical protein